MIRTAWTQLHQLVTGWWKQRARQADSDEEARTSAMGLLTLAEEFGDAATCLREKYGDRFNRVMYFTLGHGIELGLKAYLRARGATVIELRKGIGHNLQKALRKADARGLGLEARLSEAQRLSLNLFSRYYASKRFEYFLRGHLELPRATALAEILVAVLGAVRPACWETLPRRR